MKARMGWRVNDAVAGITAVHVHKVMAAIVGLLIGWFILGNGALWLVSLVATGSNPAVQP